MTKLILRYDNGAWLAKPDGPAAALQQAARMDYMGVGLVGAGLPEEAFLARDRSVPA